MKQYELDAAVKVAKDAILERMHKGGFDSFVSQVHEHEAELRDIVQYSLQAAEDERKKREKK